MITLPFQGPEAAQRFTILFLFISFSCLTLQVACLGGSFQTIIMAFNNEKGLTNTGRGCSPPPPITLPTPRGFNNNNNNASVTCRTYFRICLSHYQAQINYSNCTFGSTYTPVYINNSLFFPTSTTDASPPYLANFNFSFAWPGDFSLTIEGWNDMSASQGEWSLPDPSDELIFRHSKSYLNLTPSRDWLFEGANSTNQKSFFKLRVLCDNNFYGPRCTKHCIPRDDEFGHYKCDDNSGSKVCLDGWTGEYCRNAVCEDCFKGNCKEPGICECNPGWRGESCNECVPADTCDPEHGFCTQPGGCECKEGWGGENCKLDLQYCSHHPGTCKNGGTCINSSPSGFICSCLEGFKGETCSERIISSPCQCPCPAGELHCKCPLDCTTSTPNYVATNTSTTITTTTTTTTTTITVQTTTELISVTLTDPFTDRQRFTLILCLGVIIPIILILVAALTLAFGIRRRRARAGKARSSEMQQNNQNSRIFNKTKNCEVVIRNDCSRNVKDLNLLSNSATPEKTVNKTAPPLPNTRDFPSSFSYSSAPSAAIPQNLDKYSKNLNRQKNYIFDNSYLKHECTPSFVPLRQLDNSGDRPQHHRPPYKSVVVSLESPGSPSKSPKKVECIIPHSDKFPPVTTDFTYVSSLSSDDSSIFSDSLHPSDEKIESTMV